MPSRILRPCVRSILRTFSDRFSEHQSICKEGVPWRISVAEYFSTEILLISDEFFTENGLSTELGISWGPGDFGEHVPDAYQHRRTPTCSLRRPTVFCRRPMKDFRGGPASSSAIFANTKCGRSTWPFPWKYHHGNWPRNSFLQAPYSTDRYSRSYRFQISILEPSPLSGGGEWWGFVSYIHFVMFITWVNAPESPTLLHDQRYGQHIGR